LWENDSSWGAVVVRVAGRVEVPRGVRLPVGDLLQPNRLLDRNMVVATSLPIMGAEALAGEVLVLEVGAVTKMSRSRDVSGLVPGTATAGKSGETKNSCQ
jgi:hypothetical protein